MWNLNSRVDHMHKMLYIALIFALSGVIVLSVPFLTNASDMKSRRVAMQFGEVHDTVVNIQNVYLGSLAFYEQFKIDVGVPSELFMPDGSLKGPGLYSGFIRIYSSAGLPVYVANFDYENHDKILIEVPEAGVYTIRVEAQGFNQYWTQSSGAFLNVDIYIYQRPLLIIGPILVALGVVAIIAWFFIMRKKGISKTSAVP